MKWNDEKKSGIMHLGTRKRNENTDKTSVVLEQIMRKTITSQDAASTSFRDPENELTGSRYAIVR